MSARQLQPADRSVRQRRPVLAELHNGGERVALLGIILDPILQELLQFDLNVKGIIAIGTRVVRPLELKSRLTEIEENNLFWMHGECDHRVSLEAGLEIPELFEEAGWDVHRIQHRKGHMIPIEFHENLKDWLQNL